MFDSLINNGFQVAFHAHAKAILSVDFPSIAAELEDALANTTIPIEEIIAGGGGESKGTPTPPRKPWRRCNGPKRRSLSKKRINGIPRESVSHEIDHVREFWNGNRFNAYRAGN